MSNFTRDELKLQFESIQTETGKAARPLGQIDQHVFYSSASVKRI